MERKSLFNLKTVWQAILGNKIKILLISILALLFGSIYANQTAHKSYYSETNMYIRKVCETAVIDGIVNIIESDTICINTYEQINKTGGLRHSNGSRISLKEMQDGIQVFKMLGEYRIIIRFKNYDSNIVNEFMATLIDESVTFIYNNNVHYKNNLERYEIDPKTYKALNYDAYKILFVWLYISLISILGFSINTYYNPVLSDLYDYQDNIKLPNFKVVNKENKYLFSEIEKRKQSNDEIIGLYFGCVNSGLKKYIQFMLMKNSPNENVVFINIVNKKIRIKSKKNKSNNYFELNLKQNSNFDQIKNKINIFKQDGKNIVLFIRQYNNLVYIENLLDKTIIFAKKNETKQNELAKVTKRFQNKCDVLVF